MRFLSEVVLIWALPIATFVGRRKGANFYASKAVASCWRTDFENVRRPNSLMEAEIMRNAIWYTLGFATECNKDWQRGEFTGPVPTKKGCGMPSMMAI